MALHKTDYGLVYDDEGALCITKRTDDVPFAGTTAWAVETSTTNEVTDQDHLSVWSIAQATRELITDGYWKGWYKVHATHTGSYGMIAQSLNIYTNPDETKTWSLDFYSPTGNVYPYLTGSYAAGTFIQISQYRWAKTWTNTFDTGKNEGCFFKTDFPADTDIDEVFYYRWYQCESKPFATSFVDGTRADTFH